MSFDHTTHAAWRYSPYPEVQLEINGSGTFKILSPWLSLDGKVDENKISLLSAAKKSWTTPNDNQVSLFLEQLSHYPLAFAAPVQDDSPQNSLHPITAFYQLRREYLLVRHSQSENINFEKFMNYHLYFLQKSDALLAESALRYGEMCDLVNTFRSQEVGHWRLIKDDIDHLGISQSPIPESLLLLVAECELAVQKSFFLFCVFVSLCEGSFCVRDRTSVHKQIMTDLEHRFGADSFQGLKKHFAINDNLNHSSIIFDFLALASSLDAAQYEEALRFVTKIAHLQNQVGACLASD